MTRRTIYWKTRDRDMIRSIRRFFGWPVYSSINGMQTVNIRDEHMEVFRKTEERGHFETRHLLPKTS